MSIYKPIVRKKGYNFKNVNIFKSKEFGENVKKIGDAKWLNKQAATSLMIVFDDILNATLVVGDVQNLADWNTFFDLPIKGTPFTSVTVNDDIVLLTGATAITLKTHLFTDSSLCEHIIKFMDNAGCITTTEDQCFMEQYSPYMDILTDISLPALVSDLGQYLLRGSSQLVNVNLESLVTVKLGTFTSCLSLNAITLPAAIDVGVSCFNFCDALTIINLPVVENLGDTCSNDNVFSNITGQTITLTIPSPLMTCNLGAPDDDIQQLQGANTVTIITV